MLVPGCLGQYRVLEINLKFLVRGTTADFKQPQLKPFANENCAVDTYQN